MALVKVVVPKVLVPLQVLLSERSVDDAAPESEVRYPLVIPHALAEVVENASPWLRERKLVALVVEKARFWLRARKLVAEVVLNAAP